MLTRFGWFEKIVLLINFSLSTRYIGKPSISCINLKLTILPITITSYLEFASHNQLLYFLTSKQVLSTHMAGQNFLPFFISYEKDGQRDLNMLRKSISNRKWHSNHL